MKVYILIPLLLFFSQPTFAHHHKRNHALRRTHKERPDFKNSIIFSGTNYQPGLTGFKLMLSPITPILFPGDDQVGVYYRRSISKHWEIQIGYGEWNTLPWYRQHFERFFVFEYPLNKPEIGELRFSYFYKMEEAYVQYVFRPIRNLRVRPALGISYTSGLNATIDSVYQNPEPPHDGIIYSSDKKFHYWGIVPAISIDYLCLNKRVSVGADVRRRYYFGNFFRATECGFHLGFNF